MSTSESGFTLPDDFTPVPVRPRHDGWSPERQVAFLQLLAECGCVREAARGVGLSVESAYRLVRRPDAQSFRLAWKLAVEVATERLSDAVLSRAIHGVEVPHFFAGERIGTHRKYDERLAMFILRARMPEQYGREPSGDMLPGERTMLGLGQALRFALRDAVREMNGMPRRNLRDDELDDPSKAQWVAERWDAEEEAAVARLAGEAPRGKSRRGA